VGEAAGSPLALTRRGEGDYALAGPLTAQAPKGFWDGLLKDELKGARPGVKAGGRGGPVRLDLGALTALDLNGAAQLLWLGEILARAGRSASFSEPPAALAPIWELAARTLGPAKGKPRPPGLVEEIGLACSEFFRDLARLVAFMGEILACLGRLALRPWRIRWALTMSIVERAVINALGVTCLVSFLVGLILAFQAAMFMKLFGVDIFVADLVGLSLVRELGTLLTAIVLTGRSGSAFSAELGSMKANQEIDAFLTMGLSPVADLAIPRVLALTMATPLLTVLADFTGLIGGNVVMVSLGHPVAAFWVELSSHLDASDVSTGLAKAFVFGLVVAMVGCQRGLAAGDGPGAVGEATTRGVVTNIVLLAFLDSLFAVLFYVLDW
jgi:phospholipid/cholesterol/gamma-HCH transport system permease protein